MSLPCSPDDPQALHLSEALSSRISAVAGVGGWALELDSGELFWAEETRRIHRVPPGFVPTVEAAIAFYAPEAQPVIRAAVEACMRTGEGWDFELPLVRADGEPFWARVVGAAEFEGGRPVRLFGAFQDITLARQQRMAVEQARQQLSLAMDSGRIGVWHVDPGAGGAVWDDWIFRQYGREPRPGLVSLETWTDWLHPGDRGLVLKAIGAALAGQPQSGVEFRVVWPDGSIRHLRAAAHPIRGADGRVQRVVGLNWDVTPERQLEAALRTERERLQVTLRSIGDAVVTTDGEGRIDWMNPAAERLARRGVAEVQGQALEQVFPIRREDAREVVIDPVARCLAEGLTIDIDAQGLLLREGGEAAVEVSASPIRDDGGRVHGAVVVIHDVTEQRRLNHEMRFRATHDALTGLPNREVLEAELERVLALARGEGQPAALALIDLDQFKVVNDTCGHAAGDLLLRQVARLFVDTARSRDVVARVGGDEFAIVMERCTPEQAQRVGQLVCERMETWRFEHAGHRFRVGASIGIAPVDERFPDVAGVMQAADSACLAAKEAGRNRAHLWRDSDSAISHRRGEMQWANRLERALDEGGFELFHRHIVPLGDGAKGRHAEILLRLRDADGSLLPAGLFLGAAERYHLATRIDRWVVEQVLAALVRIPDLEEVGLLAVNLSGQSLSDEAFHRFAEARLEQAGEAVCRRLCVEITETAAVTNLADARRFIERVRARGVRVALDDFGAGISSFGYLKTLPVDLIKIDGQFIRHLTEDRLDEAAVRGFVEVARVLGVQTVAEFVDRPEVLERVRALGIDHAQGFLLHRPSPWRPAGP